MQILLSLCSGGRFGPYELKWRSKLSENNINTSIYMSKNVSTWDLENETVCMARKITSYRVYDGNFCPLRLNLRLELTKNDQKYLDSHVKKRLNLRFRQLLDFIKNSSL